MTNFELLLQKGKDFHGDVCPGIVLGTRMTMAGLRELGLNPLEKNRDLLVYVEIDRCAADAIQAITGCSLGHRTLKFRDYGKFAATYVNAATGEAVRVSVNQKKDDKAVKNQKEAMKGAVKTLSEAPEAEIVTVTRVNITVPDADLPGFPRSKAQCSVCGEQVLDAREVLVEGQVVCKSCAHGSYYTVINASD